MTVSVTDLSGACSLVGYQSSIDAAGQGYCRLDIGPQHLNSLGILHGGIVSMMLDNACGVAVRQQIAGTDQRAVTVSLNANFIKGAADGTVTAIGRIVGGGRKLKFCDVVMSDAEGTILATASAIFRISD